MHNEPSAITLATIFSVFNRRGNDSYGVEEVTQMQHALQAAALAEQDKASEKQITAALLHDIGHIMHEEMLPSGADDNLDDHHETRAYQWICARFGAAVADPVRLHVAAKRYLCSIDAGYAQQLSPTSYKSFLDQGGLMNEEEKRQFEAEPFYQEAVQLRKWDDLAKERTKKTPDLNHFAHYLKKALITQAV